MGERRSAISLVLKQDTCQQCNSPGLPPIQAEVGRLERITVCTRPFRAAGPRIEAEQFGSKLLIHNYGHGGSGWSLSWGSAAEVTRLASAGLLREVAVIGCGALGLTTAIALQREGARVTIYTREMPAATRSARATGSWTPDSRVALARIAGAGFAARWEQMARTSYAEFQTLQHVPGEPVRRQPKYVLSELAPELALQKKIADDPIGFMYLEDRLADLGERPVDLGPEASPFQGLHARRAEVFRFDIALYSNLLLSEFRHRGGVMQQRTFASLADIAILPESTVVNCTGYGARALLGDDSLIPVRGQIGWLPAQPEVRYSLQWDDLNVVSRPDGMVVQFGASGDTTGWEDATEEPNVQESENAVRRLAALQSRRRE